MILVVGGGFGLYGHVAALAGSGRDVATLSRYRASAEERPELQNLLPRIRWVDDVMAAARDADAVVLARTPAQNNELAQTLIAAGVGGTLVLEKPVAETPAAAAALEAGLFSAGKRWAVPYLFAECDWAKAARTALTAGKTVEIDWAHRQSPMVRGWKREKEAGGGAIAFYFIHFIALAETLLPGCSPRFEVARDGKGAVTRCSLTLLRHCARSEAIQRSARNTGLLRCARNDDHGKLTLNFRLGDQARFAVLFDGQPVVESTTPFGPLPTAGSPDPRIPMLMAFHERVAADPDFQPPAYHAAITRHWAAIEAVAHD